MAKINLTVEDINRMVYKCAKRVLREMANDDEENLRDAQKTLEFLRSMGNDDEEINRILKSEYNLSIDDVEDAEEVPEEDENGITRLRMKKRGNSKYVPGEDIIDRLTEIGIDDKEFESKNELIEKIMDKFSYYRRVEKDMDKAKLCMQINQDLKN